MTGLALSEGMSAMDQMVMQDASKGLVHAIIGVRTGWRHEPDGKTGLCHFLEHAVFLGNRRYPTPDTDIARRGVKFDGMTLPEQTLFFFTAMRSDFPGMFETLLSLVFHPHFVEEKLGTEKSTRILPAVVQESDDTPWELVRDLAGDLLFERDSRLSLGTIADVEALTGEDLADWHGRYYHAPNAFVLAHGDIAPDDVAELIRGGRVPSEGERCVPVRRGAGQDRVCATREEAKDVEVVYGFRLADYDVAWEVLRVLLGNYAVSILWEERFFGGDLAFGAESDLEWNSDIGGFLVHFSAKSADNARRVDRNLWECLESFDPDEDRVEMVKRIRILEILKMKEGGERSLRAFLRCNPFLKHRTYDDLIAAVSRVSKADVLAAVRRCLRRDNAVRAIVAGEPIEIP